jgi:hypothetical protein
MLYSKKLHNIDALRAERKALKEQAKAISKAPLFDASSEDGNEDYLTKQVLSITQRVLGSNKHDAWISTALQIALPLIKQQVTAKATRKIISTVGSELVLAYFKWKGLTSLLQFIGKKIKSKKETT